MPCHKAYFFDDEGNYTEIGGIKEIEIESIGGEEYPLPKGEVTLTFKLSLWQRIKLWFLIRRKREWTMKR